MKSVNELKNLLQVRKHMGRAQYSAIPKRSGAQLFAVGFNPTSGWSTTSLRPASENDRNTSLPEMTQTCKGIFARTESPGAHLTLRKAPESES